MDRTAFAVSTLATVGAALLLHASYLQRVPPAAAHPASHVFSAGTGNETCSLSVVDQVKAVDTFAEMLPVFKHARCFNCHGGLDITSDDHSGAEAAKSAGLDPRSLLDVHQRKTLHAVCSECHDNVSGSASRLDGTVLSGWMVPPVPMLWINKSDEQLCLLVKGFEENADSFISHVDIDHGEVQFVDAAFRGDRGMSAENMDTYDVTPEPPPGTKAELLATARRWGKLLDGNWKPLSCGCVKPKVELIMKMEILVLGDGEQVGSEFSSRVMLTPDTAAVYRGRAPIKYDRFHLPFPGNCKATNKVTPGEVRVDDLRIITDANGGSDISIGVYVDNSTGSHAISCPNIPIGINLPLVGPSQDWRSGNGRNLRDGLYYFDGFEIMQQSGSGRSMVARKEVVSSVSGPGGEARAKTIFEIWTVPGQ